MANALDSLGQWETIMVHALDPRQADCRPGDGDLPTTSRPSRMCDSRSESTNQRAVIADPPSVIAY
ncbi:hypothetical protein [Roseateles amylovorans]|uniref:Uncharacterized protein n=1 Tax=Roseateles amylovorans TaxID=2978473 RepID=A0ABY6AWH6_9BURK|nr:hypothetical protein [Roseateles amylovorans]UXH77155.1 hypothetical protein N4261_19365 [Roseateles amylovorans]